MKEWTMLVEWNIEDNSDPEAVSGSSTTLSNFFYEKGFGKRNNYEKLSKSVVLDNFLMTMPNCCAMGVNLC